MEIDNDFCIAFNTLRLNNQNKFFSRSEIHESLINNINKFPKQSNIIDIFSNNKIINKQGKGKNTKYSFTNYPIHINALKNAYKLFKEYVKVASSKCYKNSLQFQIDEEYCINFLKERGYKILKQFIEYKEI